MATKKRKKSAPRNPVARAMLTSGYCRAQVRQNKWRKNRALQKAQDRKNLSYR